MEDCRHFARIETFFVIGSMDHVVKELMQGLPLNQTIMLLPNCSLYVPLYCVMCVFNDIVVGCFTAFGAFFLFFMTQF